jgi:hypothetical protein
MIVTLLFTGFCLGKPDHRLCLCQGIGAGAPDGHRLGNLQHGAAARRHVAATGVGWVLDRNWLGATAGGARIYDATAYQAGFSLMAGCLVVSFA